ncbi:hypothetical protein [Variovorax sp. dw_308]|uniref:hypothetical protein n=1 Tax=Variovorax sp. dw_308 TaxID=2721546 RepID=UPI001C44C727|nr:hypothetical protein [Variovorax sp. dw_308]
MTHCLTTTTRLQRGEALHIPLDRLTTLEVDSGRVVVREPLHWLGETMLSRGVTLTHGEFHRLERGGWVELEACGGGAVIRSHRPAPAAFAVWLALRRRVMAYAARLSRVASPLKP